MNDNKNLQNILTSMFKKSESNGLEKARPCIEIPEEVKAKCKAIIEKHKAKQAEANKEEK